MPPLLVAQATVAIEVSDPTSLTACAKALAVEQATQGNAQQAML